MNELLEIQKVGIQVHKDEHGMLIFDNYEDIKKIVSETFEVSKTLEVNDYTYKDGKKYRAELNKITKQLTSLKTSFIKDYVNDYQEKSKVIVDILKETSDLIDLKLKNYEKSIGIAKPELLTITFKTYEKELAEKIINLGETIGLKGEIK